ncbi:hypothetical protein R1sor_021805 [Riccia sorocarpa]|uniref:Reverse transcriptase domain-containing protein n=1 Tax=Riccia sorocarpa TaxID=122646 RepID=A0ABD3GMB2_9MARC
MTLSYKIVRKLMANRVKIVLPKLVDGRQSGFVSGRHITDNILSFKIGQEWARWAGQEATFLKLDFGIACDGTAKVHINSAMTQEIKLGCGVRQGCPLAPLLYALCSQPFMKLLTREEKEGRITWLKIQENKTLLFKLFADDMGVFLSNEVGQFEALRQVLRKYELASGALINLEKSLIMPLGGDTVP